MNIQHHIYLFVYWLIQCNGVSGNEFLLAEQLDPRVPDYVQVINEVLSETPSECIVILTEYGELKDISTIDILSSLMQRNAMVMTSRSLSGWKSSMMSVGKNHCSLQISVGTSDNDLLALVEDIWESEWHRDYHKYIFITDRASMDSLVTTRSRKINDIMNLFILLVEELKSETLKLYQIEPYGGTNGASVVQSKFSWFRRQSRIYPSPNPFRNKFTNLNGKILKCAFLQTFPYIYKSFDPLSNLDVYGGIDQRVIDVIGDQLNYKLRFVDSVDGKYGSKNVSSGLFNGMIGMTQRAEVDFTIGSITRTLIREEVIDFSFTTFHTHSTFLTRKPAPVPKWKSMFEPFRIELWVGLILAVFGFPVVYFLLMRLSSHEISLSLASSSLNVLGSFINQGINHPKESSSRIMIGSWFLFSFCMAASYGGSLMSYLTFPRRQAPINTLVELAKSDLDLMILNGTLFEDVFRDSQYSVYQDIWRKFIESNPPCDSILGCFEIARDFPGWGYIMDFDILESLKITSSFDENNEDNLRLATEEFLPSQYAIVLRRNAPYLQAFDRVLIKLRQAGLIGYWRKDILRRKRFENKAKRLQIAKALNKKPDSSTEPITTDHLEGAFFVYAIGSSSALLTFIYEKIVAK